MDEDWAYRIGLDPFSSAFLLFSNKNPGPQTCVDTSGGEFHFVICL